MANGRTDYDDRTDIEKLQSQWNKISGIFDRDHEWSAAIVRAATSAEIAANIAIRKRFEAASTFSPEFVNSLLIWANGLDGKFKRLIIESEPDANRRRELQALKRRAEKLNDKRNAIVHRGAFASKNEAREFVVLAREVVLALVTPWEPGFTLDEIEAAKPKPKSKKKTSRKSK